MTYHRSRRQRRAVEQRNPAVGAVGGAAPLGAALGAPPLLDDDVALVGDVLRAKERLEAHARERARGHVPGDLAAAAVVEPFPPRLPVCVVGLITNETYHGACERLHRPRPKGPRPGRSRS